tara:strand:+ start:588 stop:950 length:363 start_codon:yes stop_codon:yes gene_type:complete
MTRRIELFEMDDFFQEQVIDIVQATTLEWTKRVKKATPVDTGRLRAAWQTKIPLQTTQRNQSSFVGLITNNVVYAEPVMYGIALPPSWGDSFRTRQGTVKGFPDLIGKELQQYIRKQFGR